MNTEFINKILKYSIITGLIAVIFTPLIVFNNFFFPFITGKAFVFRIIVEIIFAFWLVLVLREKGTSVSGTERSVAPRINSLTICITLFTVSVFVADLLGLNPLRSIWSNFERMEGWITIVHLWAYFIVLSNIFGSGETSSEKWRNFLNIMLIPGTIVALYGLFQFFGWAEIHQGSSRVDASLGNSAYMAVYMLMNCFLVLFIAFRNVLRKKNANILIVVYSILFVLYSFVLFQTATRGTIIGWIIAILVTAGVYAFFAREKKGNSNLGRIISAGVVVLVILITVSFYLLRDAQWIRNNAVLGRLATISISDTKTQARGYIWPMAIKAVTESPKVAVIGVGQENFNYIFNAHYEPKMWSQEQWFDRAHSVYLDWLTQGGIITLILYVSLYILFLIYVAKSKLDLSQKAVLIGLIVGYAIHNIFVFDNQTSYIMFFTLLAFVHSLKDTKIPKFLISHTKNSEDYITVRDYVLVPIVILLLLVTLYFIDIRPIQANQRLIAAVRECSTSSTQIDTKKFEAVFSLNQTVASQEAREQLFSCATRIIRSNYPVKNKVSFFELAKKETENQIKTTPNDARIYIIAGSFFNSIQEWDIATPYLEKANQLSPNKQSIIFDLVSNYINKGKIKEAVMLMEKAYLSATDNTDAKSAYIVSLIASGNNKKALETFANDPEAFVDARVINAYSYIKDYARTIELGNKLLKKTPSDQNAYTTLASAYIMNHQNDMAIKILKEFGENFPNVKVQVDETIKKIQSGEFKLTQ